MFRNRGRIATVVALAAASFAGVAAAQPSEAVLTCTNPSSGANWQIRIDYTRATVDSNAARISDGEISWHDPADGGNYTLDRKSGELTLVGASSTGGYFIHDRCSSEKAG
jgi:hypothetical protein